MTKVSGASINVSGKGAINAKIIAVGNRAIAHGGTDYFNSESRDQSILEITAKIEELKNALIQRQSEIKDSEALIDVTERVVNELKQSKPNRITLKGLMSVVVDETKNVLDISQSAETILSSLLSLF